MRRSPASHAHASVPSNILRVSDIFRRLACLGPDQSGGCRQARGGGVFADPRNEIRKDHHLQGGQSREGSFPRD